MTETAHAEHSGLRVIATPRNRVAVLLARILTVAVLGVAAWAATSVLSEAPAAAHECAPGQSHDGGPNGQANPNNGHLYCWSYPTPKPVDPPPPIGQQPGQDPEGLNNGNGNGNNGGGSQSCSSGTHAHSYNGNSPWCHANHTQANGDCRTHRPDGTHENNPCQTNQGALSCLGGQHAHTYNDPNGWCHGDHTQSSGDCRTHRPNGTHQAGDCSGNNGNKYGDSTEEEQDGGYSPQETASGSCGGGQVEDEATGLCRDLTEEELGGRVQCTIRDPEDTTGLHTTTYLADDPPGCPAAPDWEQVWQDRCTSATGEDLGTWDPDANDGAGGCTGAVNSDGEAGRPCFDGENWIIVYTDTIGCGASQCPVPGEPGNFIAGTNGQDCDGSSGGGNGGTVGGGVDAELCWDGIYRPPATCPIRPPGEPLTPQEPQPANLGVCRAGTTVRLAWSAVTVADPQTGYALDGWQIEWGVRGSASTSTITLAAADRSHEQSLSTSNTWTITVTPALTSGSTGTNAATVTVPSGDPATGQCPVLPLPTPTVMACRSTSGIEVEWTIPSGTWRTGTGWLMDVFTVDSTGSITGHLSEHQRTGSNPIEWEDWSITLPIPQGNGILITLLGYAQGDLGPLGKATAEATPESGCGVPTAPPPAPPTPSPPTATAPASVALDCRDDGSGGLVAEAAWGGRADTSVYVESYQVEWAIDRSGTITTIALPTASPFIDESPAQITDSYGIQAGDDLSVRVRARAAARASATNSLGTTLSSWSSFGAWSGWSASSATSRCPTPPPPPPPMACPTDPAKFQAVYPSGHSEAYTDSNGDGSYDNGERFTDINGDGTWTADLGGYPTGLCWPAGHACLTPGEVCLARGS